MMIAPWRMRLLGGLAAASVVLSLGCGQTVMSKTYGDAHRRNTQAMIANPYGEVTSKAPEGIDAGTAEDVMERYHEGQKKGGRGQNAILVPSLAGAGASTD